MHTRQLSSRPGSRDPRRRAAAILSLLVGPLIAVSVAGQPAHAQEGLEDADSQSRVHRISIETVLDWEGVEDPQLSPDG